MKLPHGDRAIVDDRKLTAYLLNPEHEHGASHAHLFSALLGIDADRSKELRAKLLEAARSGDATPGKKSPYGRKFEIRSQMRGPRGEYTILSVWMIRTRDDRPHLVTAYVTR